MYASSRRKKRDLRVWRLTVASPSIYDFSGHSRQQFERWERCRHSSETQARPVRALRWDISTNRLCINPAIPKRLKRSASLDCGHSTSFARLQTCVSTFAGFWQVASRSSCSHFPASPCKVSPSFSVSLDGSRSVVQQCLPQLAPYRDFWPFWNWKIHFAQEIV